MRQIRQEMRQISQENNQISLERNQRINQKIIPERFPSRKGRLTPVMTR